MNMCPNSRPGTGGPSAGVGNAGGYTQARGSLSDLLVQSVFVDHYYASGPEQVR